VSSQNIQYFPALPVGFAPYRYMQSSSASGKPTGNKSGADILKAWITVEYHINTSTEKSQLAGRQLYKP